MKIRRLPAVFLYSLLILSTNTALAEKMLSADEVKALFTNKTFDGYNEIREISYQVYSADDGMMIHSNPMRTMETTWEIDSKGRHCATLKRKVCGSIASMGDGIYHKVINDRHTHTMKNFVDGNQIK